MSFRLLQALSLLMIALLLGMLGMMALTVLRPDDTLQRRIETQGSQLNAVYARLGDQIYASVPSGWARHLGTVWYGQWRVLLHSGKKSRAYRFQSTLLARDSPEQLQEQIRTLQAQLRAHGIASTVRTP